MHLKRGVKERTAFEKVKIAGVNQFGFLSRKEKKVDINQTCEGGKKA